MIEYSPTEKLAQSVQNMQREFSEMKAWQDLSLKRLEETSDLSAQIGKLTANIESLTNQLKGQNERVDKLVDSYETRLRNHGERIGRLSAESEKQFLLIEKLTKKVEANAGYIDEVRMKGSKHMSQIIERTIYVVVGIVLVYIAYRLGFSYGGY